MTLIHHRWPMMHELLLCKDNTLRNQDIWWSHWHSSGVKSWGKLIGATSRTLRTGLMGHGHVSATALCGWVSWRAKHNGTVTATIVVSLVILSRMGFKAFRSRNQSSSKWFWMWNEDLTRIEIELKNDDDSIRWWIRSGSRDLLLSQGNNKL